MTHLEALQLRLSSENARLFAAKGAREINFRAQVVAGIEKEIKAEYKFLASDCVECTLTDDELLTELSA